MKRLFGLAIAAGIALLCLAWPVLAKEGPKLDARGCGPWQTALKVVKDAFGEIPAFLAMTDAAVLTVTVNDKTGSWSIFAQTGPDIMCLVATGKHWEVAPDSVRNQPEPSSFEQRPVPDETRGPAAFYQPRGPY